MTTKTTFQRAREENQMRAAIVGLGRRAANPQSALQAEVVALRMRVEKLELLLQGPATIVPRDPFPNQIRQLVANHFQLTVDEVISNRRTNILVWPRFIICHLCYEHSDITLTPLAKLIGREDHNTVRHAIAQVKERMKHDIFFSKEVLELETMVKQMARQKVDT